MTTTLSQSIFALCEYYFEYNLTIILILNIILNIMLNMMIEDHLVPKQPLLPNLKQQSSVKVADFTEGYDHYYHYYDGEHIF